MDKYVYGSYVNCQEEERLLAASLLLQQAASTLDAIHKEYPGADLTEFDVAVEPKRIGWTAFVEIPKRRTQRMEFVEGFDSSYNTITELRNRIFVRVNGKSFLIHKPIVDSIVALPIEAIIAIKEKYSNG